MYRLEFFSFAVVARGMRDFGQLRINITSHRVRPIRTVFTSALIRAEIYDGPHALSAVFTCDMAVPMNFMLDNLHVDRSESGIALTKDSN